MSANAFHGTAAEVKIRSTLHDAKERLILASRMRLNTSIKPPKSSLMRFFHASRMINNTARAGCAPLVGVFGGQCSRSAVIESHDDVCTDLILDAHT
jgi:hypothetical protein